MNKKNYLKIMHSFMFINVVVKKDLKEVFGVEQKPCLCVLI